MSETIAPKTMIAGYSIVSKIGEGGMGEVWRARDTKLGRDVAIKVLRPHFAEDGERLHRFEREAQAAGALNHPNILVIFHIGTHDGAPYIVSELLEGQTLRQRMAGGALPQRKALDYALQIAHGLAAAHEKGIVHRDIKPDNVFVTNDGRVKILDFGVAKLTGVPGGTEPQTEVPTRLFDTDPGTVMGTMGYMSPEQLKGRPADHRSDIFSFGAILYEMLTGKRAFRGDSMAERMSAILREDPPSLSAMNQKASPALERIVHHCLEKNPAERFHSARDLAFAIESFLSGGATNTGETVTVLTVPAGTARRGLGGMTRLFSNARLAWMVAAVFLLGLLAALALGVMYFNRPSTPSRGVRLSFEPRQGVSFNDSRPDTVVVSPDGQKLAFTATSEDGKWQLWVRSLDSLEAQPLPGGVDPLEPFWSPDSRSIAFGSQGKLKRVDLAGGNSQVLCDAARLTGGAWSKKGVIVFGPDYGSALFQVPATGGEPKPATIKDPKRGDTQHSNPNFLPDGKHFLFRNSANASTPIGIWVGSLDSPEVKQVLSDSTNAACAPPGWLLFLRNQTLVAQGFDASSLQLKGDAMPIINRATSTTGGRFSVSENGVLVWQDNWEREYQLIWFDREGKQIGAVGPPMKVSSGQEPHLSPDGKRLAIRREGNIWVSDLTRDDGVRLSSSFSQNPIWSPDGSHVAYNSRMEGLGPGIVRKAADGVGEAEMLLNGVNFPAEWSPDDRFILFWRRGEKTRADIWVLPLFGDRKEYPLLNSAFDERDPQLSPNGRWLAYSSDESGRYEIYVQSFTADGKVGDEKKRVSTSGGTQPNWRGDGQELFYVAEDGQMISVAVKTIGAEFEYSTPKALFKTRMLGMSSDEYDVTADGQRFLIGTMIGESTATPPTLVLNWTADLKR